MTMKWAVLRVTAWRAEGRNYFRKPRICLVLTEDSPWEVEWIVGSPPNVDPDDFMDDVVTTADDFEVIPPEEWSDEVCAYVMKRRMLT